MAAQVKEILKSLDIGNSVAEFDQSLEKYFIENSAFDYLIKDRADIIAGDKGTGKTAVYRMLQNKYASTPELSGIEVLPGFNPDGSPIFQKLVGQGVLTESQYSSVWKTYLISLVGNWLLEIIADEKTESSKRLDKLLTDAGIRSADDKPQSIFSGIMNSLQRLLSLKAAQVEMTTNESGMPVVTPRLEFGGEATGKVDSKEISHEVALPLLNSILNEHDITVWVAIDRLDEAFQGSPEIEIPALRALLRTYLDLLEFNRLKLKLFVRRDLFRKIIGDGFVNLTHLNARKKEILWDEQDLLNLLARRIRDGAEFSKHIDSATITDEQLFYTLFPQKVDQAERKPTTFNWVMSRIRDGNGVRPPRNLIDLVDKARDEQLRVESRTPREFKSGAPLIESDAVKAAQSILSEQRVQDTLIAEAGAELARHIEKFRRAKAEQNEETLSIVLGLDGDELKKIVKQLVEIGFLEEVRSTWKVPMLYRDGLEVTQGKAFSANGAADDDE